MIIPKYNIDPGQYDPEEIVDVVPEQAESNRKIQASEDNYLRQLETNEERRFKNTQNMWKGLEGLSTEITRIAKAKREKHREDKKAQIAFDVLTKGVSPELEEVFKGDRDILFADSLKADEFAHKYEAETGDSITAQEFREMAGWEQYALAESYVRQQAKGYNEYVYKAYETEFIVIDGEEKRHGDNLNPAEQAALDTKIKFNYARRFSGLNEALVATVVKPEIDKYDEDRRKRQAQLREEAYQLQMRESDRRAVEFGFVTANPVDGYNNAHNFAKRYAARNNTSIAVGRIAFKEHLIDLVSENKITYPEAMSMLLHEEKARDGSMKSMTSWKEWSDLPEELAIAAEKGTEAEEELTDAKIAADVQLIKSKEDLTNQQKSQMMDLYRQKYGGYVPNKIQSALAGHIDDDRAKQYLDNAIRFQDGVYDFQLANVSTDIYNKYKDKIIGTSALTKGAPLQQKAAKFIKAYTNEGTGDEFGETDAKSIEWLTLNDNLTAIFNEAYQRHYMRNGQVVSSPEDAYDAGMRAVEEVINNPGRTRDLMKPDYEDDGDETYERSVRVGMGQAGGGKWKKNRISTSKQIEKDLLEWSQTPLKQTKDLPQFIKDVARRLGISPFDLAQSQLKYLQEDYKPEEPKEPKELDPNISKLIYFHPTPSRITRARILSESQGEETSIYNNPALVRDDI